MKWKSHSEIARTIGKEIGLSTKENSDLVYGSILPDKWKDYPHHYGKESAISMRIERAREFFIKRKNPYYELGIAFHYIADKFCLPSNDPRHEEFEQQISESSITKNIDSPSVEGKRATINRALIRRSENITPNLALNLAYHICLQVARSVLSSPFPPTSYVGKMTKAYRHIMENYWKFKMFFTATCILPVLFLMYGKIGVAAFFIFIIISFLTLSPILELFGENSKISRVLASAKLVSGTKNLALFYGVVTIILLYLGSFSLFISLAIAIVQILWHYSSQIDKDIVENLDWYNWNAVTI
jgi:hypothetical protein